MEKNDKSITVVQLTEVDFNEGLEVVTDWCDGIVMGDEIILEGNKKTAKKGDFIIKNSLNDFIVLSEEEFVAIHSLYEETTV